MDDERIDERIVKWVGEGYQLGYSDPYANPGIPLDEPWMTYYCQGFEAGCRARQEADLQYGGAAISPDIGGEGWEHYQRRWKELLEPIFHEHMPHTEIEMEIPEPPPINVIR